MDKHVEVTTMPPLRLRKATIEGITAHPSFDRIRQYVSNLGHNVRQGIGLGLCGPNGAGKSGALAAIFLALQQRGWRTNTPESYIWCQARDIALNYQTGKVGGHFDTPVDSLLEHAQCLVIDELGKELDVKNSRQRLLHLLSRRHSNELLTSFTSNLSPEGLAEHYGDSFLSRLREAYVLVEVDGEDRRGSERSQTPTAIAKGEGTEH